MLVSIFISTLITLGVSAIALGISVIFNCTLCSKIISVVMMILGLIIIVSFVLIILQGDILCL
jgi:hypothetical protein